MTSALNATSVSNAGPSLGSNLSLHGIATSREQEDFHTPSAGRQRDVCLIVGKDSPQWKGVNTGVMIMRNTRTLTMVAMAAG